MDHDLLLSRIDAYCRQYRISEATFGGRFMNNSKFVPRLRSGGSLTLRTLTRLDIFLAQPTAIGRQKIDSEAA